MNETETRAALIDPVLRAAGWGVVEGSRIRMEFPINKGRLIGHGQRSKPDTRKKLLEELTEKGFAKQQLTEFQKILNAENSDLYDVLAYIAFHSDILERADRADKAKIQLFNYDPKQQEFLTFVLSQYVKQGIDELDDTKISDLLILKYHAIADAKKELGDIHTIRNTFIGFQTYLYDKRVAI